MNNRNRETQRLPPRWQGRRSRTAPRDAAHLTEPRRHGHRKRSKQSPYGPELSAAPQHAEHAEPAAPAAPRDAHEAAPRAARRLPLATASLGGSSAPRPAHPAALKAAALRAVPPRSSRPATEVMGPPRRAGSGGDVPSRERGMRAPAARGLGYANEHLPPPPGRYRAPRPQPHPTNRRRYAEMALWPGDQSERGEGGACARRDPRAM